MIRPINLPGRNARLQQEAYQLIGAGRVPLSWMGAVPHLCLARLLKDRK